jgi:hypothetical protein
VWCMPRWIKNSKKVTKLRVLIDGRNIGSRHCSNKYKHNMITTLAYAILSVKPPQ